MGPRAAALRPLPSAALSPARVRSLRDVGGIRPIGRVTPIYGWRTSRGGIQTMKGDHAALVKYPEEQKTLRRRVRLRDQGEGPQGIANKLNPEKRCPRNGKPWARQTIWRTLDRYDDRQAAIEA